MYELGFPELWRLAEGTDGDGGGLAACAQGAERGRVSGVVRDRGCLPQGAVRDALAPGAELPWLWAPRLLPAEDSRAVPVQPLQAAGAADRRHGVPRHQAAAHHLVRGHLPPDAEQEWDQLDRARAQAGGQAADRLADEAQADAGDGCPRDREAQARRPG